jgi:hypothetical protein
VCRRVAAFFFFFFFFYTSFPAHQQQIDACLRIHEDVPEEGSEPPPRPLEVDADVSTSLILPAIAESDVGDDEEGGEVVGAASTTPTTTTTTTGRVG